MTSARSPRLRQVQDELQARVAGTGGRRHGVVVGIDKYANTRLNLRCAAADARSMYDLMLDTRCGLFRPEHVALFLDATATSSEVWKALARLPKEVSAEDSVWVYFAGHAALEDGNAFWVMHDTDVDALLGTGLEGSRIATVLAKLQCRQVVLFLDCCHAGATAVQRSRSRATLRGAELFEKFAGKGSVTLAASDGMQKSVELADHGHGAFTYHLVQGLRGAADRNLDGVVTIDELWDYLDGRVTDTARRAGVKQTPTLIGAITHRVPLTINPEVLRAHELYAELVDRALIALHRCEQAAAITREEHEQCRRLLSQRAAPAGSADYDRVRTLLQFGAGEIGFETFRAHLNVWHSSVEARHEPVVHASVPPRHPSHPPLVSRMPESLAAAAISTSSIPDASADVFARERRRRRWMMAVGGVTTVGCAAIATGATTDSLYVASDVGTRAGHHALARMQPRELRVPLPNGPTSDAKGCGRNWSAPYKAANVECDFQLCNSPHLLRVTCRNSARDGRIVSFEKHSGELDPITNYDIRPNEALADWAIRRSERMLLDVQWQRATYRLVFDTTRGEDGFVQVCAVLDAGTRCQPWK